ncbi:MAG: metal-dependent hydrolase [Bacteroidia bacterium]
MASLFGHAALGYTISKLSARKLLLKTVLLCIVCTIIPDADFIGYKLGVPYDSTFGHRGFSHSIFFALLFALLITAAFYKSGYSILEKRKLFLLFFICTLSHGLLDSLTNGGLGVAYFSPFSNTRYFFPWRPIQVSPLGAAKFFSERGLRVIKSEALWIGLPCTIVLGLRFFIEKLQKGTDQI